jgi:outer membrane protein assembly factor BamB
VATVDPATGIVTATTTGAVVLTAEIGAVAGAAQITIVPAGPLPAGTVRWASASTPGATANMTVPGPGGNRPDLFAVDTLPTEARIRGLAIDGRQLWEAVVPGTVNKVSPNGAGGVLLTLHAGCDNTNPMRLISIDGRSGVWAWQFIGASACTFDLPEVALRSDGPVAVVTPGNLSGFPSFMLLNAQTGSPISVPPVPTSTFTSQSGQQTQGYSRVGPPIVDRFGVVHFLYEQRTLAFPPQVVTTGVWLMSFKPDSTWSTTQLSSSTNNVNLFPGRLVPDGTDGLLASWIESPVVPPGEPPAQSTLRAARIGGGVGLFDLPLTLPLDLPRPPNSGLPINPELTLTQDGRVVLTYGDKLIAFNPQNGALLWSYDSAGVALRTVVADTSNGVLLRREDSITNNMIYFDGSGASTSSTWPSSGVSFHAGGTWFGRSNGAVHGISVAAVEPATTGWFAGDMRGANQQTPNLFVSNPLNTTGVPPIVLEQDTIRDVLARIRSALQQEATVPSPSCGPWLDNNPSKVTALSQIDLMLQANSIGHGLFWGNPQFVGTQLYDTAAIHGGLLGTPPVPIGVPMGWAITINRESSFFKSQIVINGMLMTFSQGPQRYAGGSLQAQLLIMLHEIAHMLKVIPSDYGIAGGSATNDATVNTKCGTMINGIQP